MLKRETEASAPASLIQSTIDDLLVLFQFLEDVKVTQSGLLQVVVDLLHGLLRGALLAVVALGGTVLAVLEGTGVAHDDLLRILVELDDLEVEGLAVLGFALVGLVEVTHRGEGLDVIGQHDGGTLVVQADNATLMHGANVEEALVDIPGVLLKLLVTKAKTTVLGIDLEDEDYLNEDDGFGDDDGDEEDDFADFEEE